MHFHNGFLDALNFLAMLLGVGTVIRLVQARYPNSALGKALHFIY